MSVLLRKLAYLSVVFLMSGCIPPAKIKETTDSHSGSLLTIVSPDSVNAAADIVFRIQKKTYSGNLVVKRKDTTLFDARVYSSLGFEIASVKSDSKTVMLEYNDQIYEFSSLHAMDSMPFIWAKAIGLGEFQSFFTGNLTPFKTCINSKPDTTLPLKGNMTSLRWLMKDRNLQLELIINRKKPLPIQVILSDFRENSSWSIVFKNFHDGRAYSLLFKEDDNNYFSINYDKLKFFNGSNLL
jgi:hypothetical protein